MLPALDKMPREALLAGIAQERKGRPCCFLKWICGDGDLPPSTLVSSFVRVLYLTPVGVIFFPCWTPEQVPMSIPTVLPVKWILSSFLCGSAPQAPPQLSDNTRVSVDGSEKTSDWGLEAGKRDSTGACGASSAVRSHISYLKCTKSRCWKTCKFSCFSDRLFRKEIKAMEMDRKLFFSLSQIWSCAVFGIQELQKSWYPVGCLSCFTWLF